MDRDPAGTIPRDTRFGIARDFRRLCADRGYSAAEVQRLLGEDVPYQTVASWGVNRHRHHTRRKSNLPSTRWLHRILKVFPELREGASPFVVGSSVAKVEILNRDIPADERRLLESSLVNAVRLISTGDDRHFGASPGWRHPAEHAGEVRQLVGYSSAPIANVAHFIEMLGIGVLTLTESRAVAPWSSVVHVTMHGSRPANFVTAGGYLPGSEDERYALMLCLGLFLVGASVGGNAKRAAAAQFADEMLVGREALARWTSGARYITDAHVQVLARAFSAPTEVVARQCRRSKVIVRGAGFAVSGSVHAFRASLEMKSQSVASADVDTGRGQPPL